MYNSMYIIPKNTCSRRNVKSDVLSLSLSLAHSSSSCSSRSNLCPPSSPLHSWGTVNLRTAMPTSQGIDHTPSPTSLYAGESSNFGTTTASKSEFHTQTTGDTLEGEELEYLTLKLMSCHKVINLCARLFL